MDLAVPYEDAKHAVRMSGKRTGSAQEAVGEDTSFNIPVGTVLPRGQRVLVFQESLRVCLG